MGRVAIIALVGTGLGPDEGSCEVQEGLLRQAIQNIASEGRFLRGWRLDQVRVLEENG
jgi:hypothetical protein